MTFGQKFMKVFWDIGVPIFALVFIPASNWELFGFVWLGVPVYVLMIISLGTAIHAYINGEFWTKRV